MNAYNVEQEKAGCEKCGHGTSWEIVDLTGAGIGGTWCDRDDAEEHCAALNRAYRLGVREGSANKEPS